MLGSSAWISRWVPKKFTSSSIVNCWIKTCPVKLPLGSHPLDVARRPLNTWPDDTTPIAVISCSSILVIQGLSLLTSCPSCTRPRNVVLDNPLVQSLTLVHEKENPLRGAHPPCLSAVGLVQSIKRMTVDRGRPRVSIPRVGPIFRVLKWLKNEGNFFALQTARSLCEEASRITT